MVFRENDLPPHYKTGCPKQDEDTGRSRPKKLRTATTTAKSVHVWMAPVAAEVAPDVFEDVSVVNPGYVGKPKGE
jgi:hypothetical protein